MREIYKDAAGQRLPSVTTIISRFKDSGGLLYWANQAGLDGKTLDEARMPAASAGTIAHQLVEAHINKREEPELVGPKDVIDMGRAAFATYLKWQEMNKINFRHTEVSLVSETRKFGGRLDAVGLFGNELCLLDWKSSNSVYVDHLFQLGAYAELWEENYPEHPLEGGFHLCRFAKEKGDFAHHHYPSLDDERAAFLMMRDLYDRVKQAQRRVK